MKGNWTFEMDPGGQGEKHEKGKCATGLGPSHLIVPLTWEGKQCCGTDDDLGCRSEGLEYHTASGC